MGVQKIFDDFVPLFIYSILPYQYRRGNNGIALQYFPACQPSKVIDTGFAIKIGRRPITALFSVCMYPHGDPRVFIGPTVSF